MVTPQKGNRVPDGRLWAADTGCFTKPELHDDDAYLNWLQGRGNRETCLFATAPDVVADSAATLERSRPMLARIRGSGFRAALVAQDGMTPRDVPWSETDVLFLGGTTNWKLGLDAETLAVEATKRGVWLHMGRVNSLRRMRRAQAMGCQSVDGTFVAFAPDTNTARLRTWLRAIAEQPVLEGLG